MTDPSPARHQLLGRTLTWFTENGVGETSMRTLANHIGTSHRMLNYHFGSREGLLGAVVEAVEREERAALDRFLSEYHDPITAGEHFWAHVCDTALTFAPLYFELAGQAMQRKPYAADLLTWLATGWVEPLTELWQALGHDRADAEVLARLNLATVRGLLFDLAVTGDRVAVEESMRRFTEAFTPVSATPRTPAGRACPGCAPRISR